MGSTQKISSFHIVSGISTREGCCDVIEPDLSVALDVRGNVSADLGACEITIYYLQMIGSKAGVRGLSARCGDVERV